MFAFVRVCVCMCVCVRVFFRADVHKHIKSLLCSVDIGGRSRFCCNSRPIEVVPPRINVCFL